MNKSKPVVLIVLDGWGYRDSKEHNSIAEGNTPYIDSLMREHPHSLLDASGLAVGLPDGQAGNSEIGHMTMGAGLTLDTDVVRIHKAAQSGEFETNEAFVKLFDHVKQNNSTLHIQGLVSPGGVHSHHEHLFAFLKAAKKAGIEKIAIHAFTDGRDTPPQSAKEYLRELESVVEEVEIGHIATATGRYYAMDRDNNWERLAKYEDALYECKGKLCELRKPSEVIEELYAEGALDEHLEPLVFLDDKGNAYPLQKNDGVLMFNFRSDRARMLAKRMSDRSKTDNLCFVTMTQYDETIESLVAFPPLKTLTSLSKEIAKAGLKQVHIAETEKYAHATYFLNVGNEEKYQNEEWVMIDSRKDIATHDQAPEMKAKEITDEALQWLDKDQDFIFINYANADMVGHTANKEATLKAVETIDVALSRFIPEVVKRGGVVLITADHGNAEVNVDPETGERHTAHTNNLVPLITAGGGIQSVENGSLADVAPTVLHVLDIEKPVTMTGKSLVE